MAKIVRVTASIFGGGLSAGSEEVEQFGSKVQVGTPFYTVDPSEIQQLSAWTGGWITAIDSGTKAPYVQDMNAVCLVFAYQLAYILQQGIPEWDAATTYYKGSYVSDPAGSGQTWYSLQDNNLNHAPVVGASNAYWQNTTATSVGVGNALKASLLLAPNGGAPLTKTNITAALLSVQGVSLATISLVADITVSGANGLDTGVPANNNWYAVFVITNAAASLVASLYSLSATAPTLPAGYTLFRRVGWVRRNGSGNFVKFKTVGDWVYYTDGTAFTPTLSNGTNAFANYLPPTSALMSAALEHSGAPASVTWKPTGESTPPYIIATSNNPNFVPVPNASVQQLTVNASIQADLTGSGNLIAFTILGYYDPV